MDKRATKRKRVVLTIEDKLKVCRLAKQNVPKFVLMNQFKIGKSTLNDILRSEEKLTQFKAEENELGIPGAVKTCKAIRNGDFDKLDSDQIFNCDETGLYFKMLPGHTLASVHKQPDGTKKAKDRVTINACANASGTIKLPLLFIGKAKNPRCFRKINKEALPVVYRNQKKCLDQHTHFQRLVFKLFHS